MKGKTKLDNKYVEVNGNGYRLTINKVSFSDREGHGYIAYLSSTESSFSAHNTFDTSSKIETDLRHWIISMDNLNHSEDVVFDRLHNWDGVIET